MIWHEACYIKKCSSEKGLDYCFECEEFPCNEGMFRSIRLKAFNLVAKDEGLQKLAQYISRNFEDGRPDPKNATWNRKYYL